MIISRSIVVAIQIIMLISFVLLSCKPQSEMIEPVPAPTVCFLKSQQNDEVLYTITRNGAGLPVQLDFHNSNSLHITSLIEYNEADRIVKMAQENGYFIYEYADDGRLVSRELFLRKDSSDPYHKANTTLYKYNELGYIDSAIYDIYNYDRFEYDADGNVIKRYFKNYTDPEVLAIEYLAFDDKKNPMVDCNFDFLTVLGYSHQDQAGLAIPLISDHNVLSMKVTRLDGTIVNRNYTFQYNELGYPTFCNETEIIFAYVCE